jgi:tetratricopeptide (TPR) repeat protein
MGVSWGPKTRGEQGTSARREELAMKNHLWSVLACVAVGCAETPPPAAPAQTAAPVTPPTAATPASEPALAAATAAPTTIPITSKSPRAIDEFKTGRELYENLRPAEALEHFKKALELDPGFAQAHAYIGFLVPATEGRAELDKAADLAKNLPDAERLSVESMVAERRGDDAKVAELTKKLVQLVPGDWRAHWYVGTRASMQRHWDDASTELKKAVELNPKAGSVYNQLGYSYLFQGKKDDAVAAFKNYMETAPTEPNAHDSLADALLAASRLDEAEAEYKKALEVSPQFWFSWGGVAATRGLRADWKGAYEALASAAKAGPRPSDKLQSKSMLAWTQFAEGKTADAIETAKSLEKEADAQRQPVNLAYGGLDRVAFLIESGKAKDALKALDDVTARTEKDTLPGEALGTVRRLGLVLRATAQEKLGKKDDLAKTQSELKTEVNKQEGTAQGQSFVEFVEGLGASAGGDAKGAAAHFDKCIAEHPYCKWRLVMALEKSGDKAGAAAAKQKIVDTPTRETMYLYVRAKLGTITKPKK